MRCIFQFACNIVVTKYAIWDYGWAGLANTLLEIVPICTSLTTRRSTTITANKFCIAAVAIICSRIYEISRQAFITFSIRANITITDLARVTKLIITCKIISRKASNTCRCSSTGCTVFNGVRTWQALILLRI